MNTTLNQHPVTVTVSNCTEHDARCVLTHLTEEFPDRSPAQGAPDAGAGAGQATVWTAELDAGTTDPNTAGGSRTGGLDGPVSLTAQGAPHDVTTVRAALAHAFTVEDAGSVSGDQERESQFRLTAR
ncbi:hypothetical protein ACQB60_29370 [Actinomycetota bacterium Odt1-20B]